MLSGGIKFAGTTADKVGSIDKLSYIGESVLDLVRDGKILGGLITVGEDGQTTVTMTEIDVEGKTPAEIKEMCQFDLDISRVAGETKVPTREELRIIHEVLDPSEIFIPKVKKG